MPPSPRTLRFDIRSLGSTFKGNQEDPSPVSGWVFHTAGKACRFQNIPAAAYCFSACF